MVVTDDDVTLPGITMSHSINVRPGDNPNNKVVPVIEAFQKEIDNYQASQATKASQPMTDAITAIMNGVNV